MEKITVYCKNTKTSKQYDMGTTAAEVLADQDIENKEDIIAALINNKCQTLSYALFHPKDIEFIDMKNYSGRKMYIMTICMILAKAVHDLYPEAVLRIEHPIADGYYCNITNLGDKMINEEMITSIKVRMQEIIARDYPIIKHEEKKEKVIELFKGFGENDYVMILESLNTCYAYYYEIDGYYDVYLSPLLSSTGKVPPSFDLFKYHHGLFLNIASKKDPYKQAEFYDQPKLYEAFKRNVDLNNIIGISNIGELNKANKEGKIFELVKIAEALHEKEIVRIADKIADNMELKKFVMISGPSSSGKTTFSKRLSVQLLASGIKPITISLDNYFVERDRTPRDENGDYDFESLYALDIDLFNQQLQELLEGKEVSLPTYNFETGKRVFKGNKVKLKDNNIVMMEGIHALNPALTPSLNEDEKFKIYVSALTTISLTNHNWISTIDNRLIRRMVRDYKYRANSVQDTIARWMSVRRGEDKWIFPFQENADVMFNSALIFELAVLKTYIMPLLQEVPKDSPEYTEANRIMRLLTCIKPMSNRDLPSTSLLREFLGGSSFKY